MDDAAPQSIPAAIHGGVLGAVGARTAAVFYFCNTRPGGSVVGQILDAVVARAGRRALVLTRSSVTADLLSRALWSYRRASFLPHGTADANAALHPVLLTERMENLNGADVLLLPDGEPLRCLGAAVATGSPGPFLAGFRLIATLVDATDPLAMRGAAESWNDAIALGYEPMAFEREIPKSSRRAAPAPAVPEFESHVPLRWHRLA